MFPESRTLPSSHYEAGIALIPKPGKRSLRRALRPPSYDPKARQTLSAEGPQTSFLKHAHWLVPVGAWLVKPGLGLRAGKGVGGGTGQGAVGVQSGRAPWTERYTSASALGPVCDAAGGASFRSSSLMLCSVFSFFKVYFCVPLSKMHLPTVRNRRNSYSPFSSNENFSGSFAVIDVA